MTSIATAIVLAGAVLASCGSSTPPNKSTTTTLLTTQPAKAIWPFVGDGVRYVTPVAAAKRFAVDYVGMTRPLVGAFTRTDARGGFVPVRSYASGPITTVYVSRLTGDASWWVSAASTPEIQVSTPTSMQIVQSPMATSGTSTAFEAVVNVTVRADGSLTPLVKTTVMGGSMGTMGPFTSSVHYGSTSAAAGAVTYLTVSMKDGSVIEATVVRVRF